MQQLDEWLDKQFGGIVEVVNVGAGAMWSQWGVENLTERVLPHAPDVVFIEFGINDAYLPYTTTTELCRLNLCYMLDRVNAELPHCECVLQCMNVCIDEHSDMRPNLAAYYQVYRAVAAERRLTLVDHESLWAVSTSTTTTPVRAVRPTPRAVLQQQFCCAVTNARARFRQC